MRGIRLINIVYIYINSIRTRRGETEGETILDLLEPARYYLYEVFSLQCIFLLPL